MEGDESGFCAAGAGAMAKRKPRRFGSAEGADDYSRLRPLWEVNASPDVGADGAVDGTVGVGVGVGGVGVGGVDVGVDVDVDVAGDVDVDGDCCRSGGGGVSCGRCCCCYRYCLP